jgi:hypothetical protein
MARTVRTLVYDLTSGVRVTGDSAGRLPFFEVVPMRPRKAEEGSDGSHGDEWHPHSTQDVQLGEDR